MHRIFSLTAAFFAILGFAATVTPAFAAVSNHSVEMPALAPGTYPVACSNLAVDNQRLAQLGGSFGDYLDGANDHYIGDILAARSTALLATPRIPNTDLYPGRRNTTVEFAVITCYPTDATNARPDYVLPDGQRIPRMQRAGESPIFAPQACIAIFPPPPECGRWPMLVFSHGLAANPVDGRSIDFLVRLASYGYVVAAPFHGDGRFSRVRFDDLSDVFYLFRNFDNITEMQALRPLAIKSTIDLMLSHSQFANAINADRIGGVGASMGGASFTWLAGAEITCTYPGLASRPTETDPRIKAVMGYVPYAGQRLLPAFGDDNATARNVRTPYLAISGTADTTAPMFMMEQAMNNFRGARYLVALTGVEHTYTPAYADDVFGWAIPFFAAYLDNNLTMRDRLTRQKNIRGGLDDNLRIDYTAPSALLAGEVLVEEFYNSDFRRYFLTSRAADKSIIDRGLAGKNWARTTDSFKGYTLPGPTELRVPSQAPVCRFFFPAILTHFFSAETADCNLVRNLAGTIDEGIDFWTTRARDVASCPTGTYAVTRLYNNRWRENDSNHRYTTSRSLAASHVAQGWIDEGVVMCAPL